MKSNVFKVGDQVTVIDEAIDGTVSKVKTDAVVILTNEGFELSFTPQELIMNKTYNSNIFHDRSFDSIIKEKELPKKPKSVRVKPKERNSPMLEVDLHIHQITTKHKHLSNFDILNIQLDTAKYKLDFAIRKRIQKIVFIHGVGDGVLKTELDYLFRRYDNLDYYPADYQKYGQGATEVYVKQK